MTKLERIDKAIADAKNEIIKSELHIMVFNSKIDCCNILINRLEELKRKEL